MFFYHVCNNRDLKKLKDSISRAGQNCKPWRMDSMRTFNAQRKDDTYSMGNVSLSGKRGGYTDPEGLVLGFS